MITNTWGYYFGTWSEILTSPVTWFVAAIVVCLIVCDKLNEEEGD